MKQLRHRAITICGLVFLERDIDWQKERTKPSFSLRPEQGIHSRSDQAIRDSSLKNYMACSHSRILTVTNSTIVVSQAVHSGLTVQQYMYMYVCICIYIMLRRDH